MPIEPATRAVPCRAALRRAVCPCGCGRGRPTKAEPLRSLLSVARRAEPCLLAVNRPEIEPCPRALALRAASPHRQVLLCLGRRSRQSLRVRLALLGPPPFRPHSHAVPLWMVRPRLQSKAKQSKANTKPSAAEPRVVFAHRICRTAASHASGGRRTALRILRDSLLRLDANVAHLAALVGQNNLIDFDTRERHLRVAR